MVDFTCGCGLIRYTAWDTPDELCRCEQQSLANGCAATLATKTGAGPSMFIVLVGFYGYILWTFALSFTNSTFLPSYKWVGLAQYARLMDNDRWWVASKNLAVFGGMFIAISLVIGVLLAVLLDQRIRREGMIRTIYLYPMALSMIVTGTAWKWLLNPGLGLDKMLRDWGWEGFRFDWLIDQTALCTAWLSRRSGSPPASSWRCFWQVCVASISRSFARPRWMARVCR